MQICAVEHPDGLVELLELSGHEAVIERLVQVIGVCVDILAHHRQRASELGVALQRVDAHVQTARAVGRRGLGICRVGLVGAAEILVGGGLVALGSLLDSGRIVIARLRAPARVGPYAYGRRRCDGADKQQDYLVSGSQFFFSVSVVDQLRPVCPKAPSSRRVRSSSSTGSHVTCEYCLMTIWQMRSPSLTVKSFSPRLMRMTPISPR